MTMLTNHSLRTASFVLLALTAAGGAYADYWYGDFVENETVVFVEGAELSDSADPGSGKIANLPAGTAVTILGAGVGEFETGGFSSYWYEVSCSIEGVEVTGYVPGAFLAMSDMPLGGDTLFMFNVTGFDPDLEEYIGEAKVIAGGEMLDSFFFEPIGSGCGRGFYPYNTELITFDPTGLSGIRDLMRLSFIYAPCGYENPDLLFAWTGEKLVLGPEGMNEAEDGVYIYSSEFILPSDEEGADDAVIVLGILQIWDEAVEDYLDSEIDTVMYNWTGSDFREMGIE